MKSSNLKIGIIDYGMGNLRSVQNALSLLGQNSHVVSDGRSLESARCDALVLPGVGAFGAAMRNLLDRELIEPLEAEVRERKVPILGVCLGMQLLVERSLELGVHQGLGWIPGEVIPIDSQRGSLAVPHVGWNTVSWRSGATLAERLHLDDHFYFDHSYAVSTTDDCVTARVPYGDALAAGIQKGHVFGVQFHPEKSQRPGLKLLRNFLRFCEGSKHA